jgi:OOP family OmpA-OmpF porin
MRLRDHASTVLAALIAAAPLAATPAAAVNLVPNASFESYVNCPVTFGQFFETVSWTMPNTGTSDLFNVCSPGGFPSVSVPVNTIGNEAPVSGVGYAGIIPYSAAPDYREYVQAQLTSALVANATYTVSFNVSLGDTCSIAVDRLGAYFSVGPLSFGNDAPIAVTPQVESPANVPLDNSTGWTTISGSFVAAGGETHIILGSFRDDAATNTSPGPSVWPGGAYYYIDDVSVEVVNTQVDQACCLPSGACVILTPDECTAQGGVPLGVGVSCSSGGDDPCGPTPARKASWGTVKRIYR